MKALAKAVLPKKLVQAIGQWRLRQREWKVSQANVGRSTSEVFSEIYANNTWGGKPGEFHSGSGSYGLAATLYLDTINEFIANHNVRSVVDVGCGDYEIGARINVDDYTGVDVVPALIDRNNAEFGSAHRRFMCLDAAGADALPSGDLCLVRQVMQHLSNDQIQVILGKLKAFKYVIVTEHQPSVRDFKAPNIDKAHGKDTRLYYGSGVYLDKKPYGAKLTLLAEHPGKDDDLDIHARGPIRTFLVDV
jgi:SAM-dependent methyltransferase